MEGHRGKWIKYKSFDDFYLATFGVPREHKDLTTTHREDGQSKGVKKNEYKNRKKNNFGGN